MTKLQSPAPHLLTSVQAAIVLSASVTLVSLPGLDNLGRIAGFVAILCSVASMISAVIALFRYKADVERAVVYMGGEGLVMLSVSSTPQYPTEPSLTSPKATKHCDVVAIGFPRVGDRRVYHRNYVVLVPRFHNYLSWHDQTTLHRLHALDGRRSDGCIGWGSHYFRSPHAPLVAR